MAPFKEPFQAWILLCLLLQKPSSNQNLTQTPPKTEKNNIDRVVFSPLFPPPRFAPHLFLFLKGWVSAKEKYLTVQRIEAFCMQLKQ